MTIVIGSSCFKNETRFVHPVSICLYRPKTSILSDSDCLPCLAPQQELTSAHYQGTMPREEFASLYFEYIERIGVRKIIEHLHRNGRTMPVMLGYAANANSCHRSLLASYLMDNADVIVIDVESQGDYDKQVITLCDKDVTLNPNNVLDNQYDS